MIADTKAKTQELIDALNELARSNMENKFAIRRIEREAESLRASNTSGAFVVLGAAACLKGNTEEMHSNHRNAIAWGGGAYARFQYAISLNRLGLLAESLVYAEEGYGLDPLHTGGLELLIGITLAMGLKSRAKTYAAAWQKMHKDKAPYVTEKEIDEWRGEVRPVVSDMIETLLKNHKGLWSELAKQ